MRYLKFVVLFCLGLFLWVGFVGVIPSFSTLSATPIIHGTHSLTKENLTDDNHQEDLESFEKLTKDTTKYEGIFTLYEDDQKGKFLLEITPQDLNRNYLLTSSLATGLGYNVFLKGVALEDFPFQFRRVYDNIQVVIPNFYFRGNNPRVDRSIRQSFSDSVVLTLPIEAIHPIRKTILIDLNTFIAGDVDLPRVNDLMDYIVGDQYQLNSSYLKNPQVFPNNLEIDSVLNFTVGEDHAITLSDRRFLGFSVHYSLSEISASSTYQPRLADDRVGYFVTDYQDLSNTQEKDTIVRYINRWNLKKVDPTAQVSLVKKPITFWLDNNIPNEYRETFKQAVEVWNTAFVKAGFMNAIEVKQMPDNADWSPADVRYNTIVWAENFSSGLLGIAPAHVNPFTGEILDADVVINANVIRFLKGEIKSFLELSQGDFSHRFSGLCNSLNKPKTDSKLTQFSLLSSWINRYDMCYSWGGMQQLQMGSLALSLLDDHVIQAEKMEDYIKQFLTYLIAHEVGHTLGLRHNFHGSTLLQPEELNHPEITRSRGMVSSMMDYTAVNIAPQGVQQGDYYPLILGDYDDWSIEYGYKPSGESLPQREKRFLNGIASRSTQPELSYGTDEDTDTFRDPNIERFDLSADSLSYARSQLDNALIMWNKLDKTYPILGDQYVDIRDRFTTILNYFVENISFVSRYVGGKHFHRDHPGLENSRPPFENVALEKQKEALSLINQYLFSPSALSFSPQFLNKLAPSRWFSAVENTSFGNKEYPIKDLIERVEIYILEDLTSGELFNSLLDQELKSAPQTFLKISDILGSLQEGIFTEILHPNSQQLNIVSLRRTLQRNYLKRLETIAHSDEDFPDDAKSISQYYLTQINQKIKGFLAKYEKELDVDTLAYLQSINHP